MEGGLVAHKVSNSLYSCPKPSATANYDNRPDDNADQSVIMAWYNQILNSYQSQSSNYCEFRDVPSADDTYPRIEVFYWKITNAHAGRYAVSNQNSFQDKLRLWVNGTEHSGTVDFMLDEGENKTIELALATGAGEVNYQKDGNRSLNSVEYGKSGDWTRCTVTIIDDDNSAYIGGLRSHPYGGSWMKNKPCYERDCARDDSNF